MIALKRGVISMQLRLRGIDTATAEQVWIALTKMAVEAKKEGFDMKRVLASLREAKAMLGECRVNESSRGELLGGIEVLLEEARQGIFAVAEPMGEEFAGRWEMELKRAFAGEKIGEFPVSTSRFSAGMPGDKRWVKIMPSKKLVAESIEEIARRHGVDAARAEGGVALAGSGEQVAKALKEISALVKGNAQQ